MTERQQEWQHGSNEDGGMNVGRTRSPSIMARGMEEEEEGTLERLYDSTVNRPCQALGSCGVDGMCQPSIHFLFRPLNVFPRTGAPSSAGAASMEGLDSPYLYSPSAPVGPTACEYCGALKTDDCTSDLPSLQPSLETSLQPSLQPVNRPAPEGTKACPRPKLFFLKKKPPFATPDGWNPKTNYRLALLEPPSSIEAQMEAWGEVRGAVGRAGGRRRFWTDKDALPPKDTDAVSVLSDNKDKSSQASWVSGFLDNF